ncbi:MAG: hypothetical protein LBJ96_01450 [Holosporaceae bacterium]|jgi:hypothetical protein|nr:hypothetical protein [Holosporaceae bacterium]
MKRMLQLAGVCCFGAALVSGNVCGVQRAEKQEELLNPGEMQSALFKLAREIVEDPEPSMEEKIKFHVKTFMVEYSLVLCRPCVSASVASVVDEVNEFIPVVFRGTRDLIDSSEFDDYSTQILISVCCSISQELISLGHRNELHPDIFVGILESCWRNSNLIETARVVMRAAEYGVGGYSRILAKDNADVNLTKRLRDLIFANPEKYDAAIGGWIEENRSKDWHWKWKSLLELPILNEPEVIESLRASFRLKRDKDGFKGTSLVEYLNYGIRRFFDWRWQSFLNSPKYFIDSLESDWGNPELVEKSRSLIDDVDQRVGGYVEVLGERNSGSYLVRYLRPLVFANPEKYDAAIRGWIEECSSRNQHWKWRSLLALPILSSPEIIEPLRVFLRKVYVRGEDCVIPMAAWNAAEIEKIKKSRASRAGRINDEIDGVTSLVKFLEYSASPA